MLLYKTLPVCSILEKSLIIPVSAFLPPLSLNPRLRAGRSKRVLRASQKAALGCREARADSGAEAGDDGSVRESDGPEPPGGTQQVKLFPFALLWVCPL